MRERDHKLLKIAQEAMNVYWGGKVVLDESVLVVSLPVLDGDIEIEVTVQGGVFTVRSCMPGMKPESMEIINSLNTEMHEAAFHYVAIQDHLYLQAKIIIPDLELDDLRPPILGMAWSAGWNAARGGMQQAIHTGPASYDQFVYLADLLSCAIYQQWNAQQGSAQMLLEDE